MRGVIRLLMNGCGSPRTHRAGSRLGRGTSGRVTQLQSGKGNMKLDIRHTLAVAAAASFALASYAIAAPHGAGNGMSPGNSSFGRSQGGNPVTGSTNSTFGRTTAEEARLNSHRNSEDIRDTD